MNKNTCQLNNIQNNLEIDLINDNSINISDFLKPVKTGYVIKRKIVNNSDKDVIIDGLLSEINGICFNGNKSCDYFYANENPRLYCNLTIPVDIWEKKNNASKSDIKELNLDTKWADCGVVDGNICSSPYQPFPAILISNYNSKKGIVIGSLSQKVFYHSFQVGHNDKGCFVKIFSSFKGVNSRIIKVNEQYDDIFYVGLTNNADDINHIFDEYLNVLKEYFPVRKTGKDINRHSLIWDSWNDGIYRDVNEKMLLKEAVYLKKYFNNVEWFQLDDGYSSYCEENVDLDAHGIGVVYEGKKGIDKNKFPNGLKHYTDELKKIGFKPSVWIGLLCPVKSDIYRENKDWFLDYTERISFSQPLDITKKEVRNYIMNSFDVFINEFGFQGVKLDFWSYGFEERHNILKDNSKSGYEYRSWLFSGLRNILTDKGYIEVSCDLGTGNPFLGEYVNNFRFGIDIGSGKFENLLTTMFWSVAVLSTHIGEYLIPNSDSIGILPGLNDLDFMFAVNFQIITRTLVEISGRFSIVEEDNKRLKVLKRATKYINNGENVYFAKYDYRKQGINIPEIIYINSAFDCENDEYVTVAIFNGNETEKTISFNMSDIGLKDGNHEIEYVWEEKFVTDKKVTEKLVPHGSILLKIKK